MGHYFKPLAFVGPEIIYSYFAWMRKYSNHPEKYPLEKRYKKLSSLLRKLNKSFNAVYHIEGIENIPQDDVFCLVSNHYSNYDPLSFLCVLDKPMAFVSKKEVEKFPFVGRCCKVIDCLFMDRKDLKQSLKVMMKVQDDLKEKNKNWAIFAEGTRNKDTMAAVREMHPGTFRPAVKSRTIIVPVVMYGTHRLLKRKPVFKKYPVSISFLKPIYPEEYEKWSTEELSRYVHDIIQKELTYKIRPYDHEFMLRHNKKKYRFNAIV